VLAVFLGGDQIQLSAMLLLLIIAPALATKKLEVPNNLTFILQSTIYPKIKIVNIQAKINKSSKYS
jgi:uncharacterized membrane protein